MPEHIDCVVIGAGVVGLAIARALARSGREVLVLEAQQSIGTGISSRNSEVIHAGLYYRPGSLKARLCVAGRQLLYPYCAEHGVEHRRCGKLVVATDRAQLGELKAIQARAHANGATDVRWLEGVEVREMEPALSCVAALHSPSSGIVDSHGLMRSLQGEIEVAGGTVVCHAAVRCGHAEHDMLRLEAGSVDEPVHLVASTVINSAGLDAQTVARHMGVPDALVPPLHYAKGHYFALAGASPFARLIYPVPEHGGLGVHVTLDLAGRARFGPDVQWTERLDYDVDAARAGSFYEAIRHYWPALPDDALQPAYAGIRPKLAGPRAPASDFVIQGPARHGVAGLINLYGIESPGLTAALAIGQEVAEMVRAWG